VRLDKKPFKLLRTWSKDGVNYAEFEADYWEGPCCDGGKCTVDCNTPGYSRKRFVARSNDPNNDRTCSYWPELAKALKTK